MDVVVGRVAKAHGIAGELAVDVRTDSPEERFALGAVLAARLRNGTRQNLTVAASRPHSGRLLVRFDEVPDRTAAEVLRGALLLADTADLPPIEDPDEFYDHELEGLDAVLVDGTRVGVVREVVHGPGGDLLAIDRAAPESGTGAASGTSRGGAPEAEETLVPFVREIVPEVDVAGGRVVLNPPEGLLDP